MGGCCLVQATGPAQTPDHPHTTVQPDRMLGWVSVNPAAR